MRRVLSLCAVLACFCASGIAPGQALNIGTRLEPFLDRFLIDRLEGASLEMQSPAEAGVALRFDAPWEGRYCGYVTVFQDPEKFRMYYRGLPEPNKDGSDTEVTCYAESVDGITWTKPFLGLHEVNGTRENNVILAGTAPYSHNFAPFYDAREGVPPEQRYKALAGTSETGLAAFVSPDGLNWHMLQKGVITEGAFDSQNVAFWSEAEGKYVCYFRTWSEGPFAGYRWISRTVSDDFVTWAKPEEMGNGGAPLEHIYINQTTPYFRAPHVYVALAARFMPGRTVVSDAEAAALGIQGGYGKDCSDGVLMTSRGGALYDRTFMEGFIRPGVGVEHWTSRSNYPACGVVPTGANEMSFFVQHHYGQPTAHLVRHTLRLDGFAAVAAGYNGGEMVTKPLRFEGEALLLNFATSAAGSVRVELQDADGNVFPGFGIEDSVELVGNFISRPAAWKSGKSPAELAGKDLRVRFVMKDSRLYSMRFGKAGE